MTVRLAAEADIPQLVLWGARLFERAGWPDWVSCDAASMENTLRHMMANEKAAVFVHEHGFAGANVVPAYFNYAIAVANKMWWWTEPGHLRACYELFSAMEAWAIGMGAKVFLTSASGGMPGAERLYRKAGYTAANQTFMKRIAP